MRGSPPRPHGRRRQKAKQNTGGKKTRTVRTKGSSSRFYRNWHGVLTWQAQTGMASWRQAWHGIFQSYRITIGREGGSTCKTAVPNEERQFSQQQLPSQSVSQSSNRFRSERTILPTKTQQQSITQAKKIGALFSNSRQ